jgi:hypothetical protein
MINCFVIYDSIEWKIFKLSMVTRGFCELGSHFEKVYKGIFLGRDFFCLTKNRPIKIDFFSFEKVGDFW